jgi:DNA-binding LacI/PurR family transcriptional regulator
MHGIRRLAKHLDISIGTVSRALNGRPDVSETTRQRVLEAARQLGYVANQSGRSLRQGVTNAVGFMIELNLQTAPNSDNFFMSVFAGVARSLSAKDLDLLVLPCSTEDDPAEYLRRIIGRRTVDAVILSATQRNDPRIEMLTAAGVPFVLVGRSETPGNYPWIDLDFEDYVDTSVARLAGLGHRRIAAAVPMTRINLRYVITRRYRAAMKRHGLEVSNDWILPTRSDEQGGYDLVDRMLAQDEPPTAVILSYELMAVGLYHRLDELGLVPGRDLSVIGLRESAQSRSLFPRLTCYRIDLIELGRALGDALIATMPLDGARPSEAPVRKRWPLQLIPGESDAPPRD